MVKAVHVMTVMLPSLIVRLVYQMPARLVRVDIFFKIKLVMFVVQDSLVALLDVLHLLVTFARMDFS